MKLLLALLLSLPLVAQQTVNNFAVITNFTVGGKFVAFKATNVAEMRGFSRLNDGDIVVTEGRVRAGDGGGANFTFVAGDTTTTNLGTVFSKLSGSGRFLWNNDQPLNVRMFGALGDATGGQEIGINAAYNYVASVTNGGEIIVPPGRYMTSAQILPRPRVTLKGPGSTRSEQYTTTPGITGFGSGGSAVIYPDPTVASFDTFYFDGPSSTELPTKNNSGETFLNGEDGQMFPFYSTLDGLCIYGSLNSVNGRKNAITVWRAMFVKINDCSVMLSRGNTLYAYGCLGLNVTRSRFVNYNGRNAFIFALSDGIIHGNTFEGGLGYGLWWCGNHNVIGDNMIANPGEDIYKGTLNGQSPAAFTVFSINPATETFTATINGNPLGIMSVTDPVFFYANGGTLPAPLAENVAYYISNPNTTAGTFTVSTRITSGPGGTPTGALQGNTLDITTAGSGNWYADQAAESNFLLYHSNGNTIGVNRVDFSVLDNVRVIDSQYPSFSNNEIYNVGRMQGLLSIAPRTNNIAGIHLVGTTSDGQFQGNVINLSTNGVGRFGVWLDGTGLYRNILQNSYNFASTGSNIVNTAFPAVNTVDWQDQNGPIVWTAAATVRGAWDFVNLPAFQNATAGLSAAVFRSEEATSTVNFIAAGSSAGLGNRIVFSRELGTLASPLPVPFGYNIVEFIGAARGSDGVERIGASLGILTADTFGPSAAGGGLFFAMTPRGTTGSRQVRGYWTDQGLSISDYTVPPFIDNQSVMQFTSTNRGVRLPQLSTTGSAAITNAGIVLYQTDGTIGFYGADGTNRNRFAYSSEVPAAGVSSVTASPPLASSGGLTPNLTHLTSGVTAGSYGNANYTVTLAVDATGHITAISTNAIPSSSGGTVTNLTAVNTNGFTWSIANPTTAPALTLNYTGNLPVRRWKRWRKCLPR